MRKRMDSTPLKGGPLSKLAGQWCQMKEFQSWIYGSMRSTTELAIMQATSTDPAEIAAEVVRRICVVDSRAELDHDESAARIFHLSIREPFSQELTRLGFS